MAETRRLEPSVNDDGISNHYIKRGKVSVRSLRKVRSSVTLGVASSVANDVTNENDVIMTIAGYGDMAIGDMWPRVATLYSQNTRTSEPAS